MKGPWWHCDGTSRENRARWTWWGEGGQGGEKCELGRVEELGSYWKYKGSLLAVGDRTKFMILRRSFQCCVESGERGVSGVWHKGDRLGTVREPRQVSEVVVTCTGMVWRWREVGRFGKNRGQGSW